MTFDLVATDIDGTLVTRGRAITPRVQAAVREAQRRGVRVCLATGRIWPAASPYVERIGADPPAILYNGGMVYDFAADRVLVEHQLPQSVVDEVLRVLRGFPGISPMVYVGERIYAERITSDIRTYMGKDEIRVEEIGSFDALPDGSMKFLVIGQPDRLAELGRVLDAVGGEPVNWVSSDRTYLEVLPPGVNKGVALREVAAHLGIPLGRVLAVGDNMNDLAMIETAGFGVAMGTGPEALRRAADFIAPGSDDDGLAVVIERFVLGAAPAGAGSTEPATIVPSPPAGGEGHGEGAGPIPWRSPTQKEG